MSKHCSASVIICFVFSWNESRLIKINQWLWMQCCQSHALFDEWFSLELLQWFQGFTDDCEDDWGLTLGDSSHWSWPRTTILTQDHNPNQFNPFHTNTMEISNCLWLSLSLSINQTLRKFHPALPRDCVSEFCRDDCIIFPGLDAVNTLNDEPIDVNHSPLESFEIISR